MTPATIVDEALKLEHEPAKDWIRGVEDMHTAAQMMVMRAHHGDVIFTVGAGDITQMDEVILHALEAHRWVARADGSTGHQFRQGCAGDGPVGRTTFRTVHLIGACRRTVD